MAPTTNGPHYMRRFIAGFCQAGTPFSTKLAPHEITNPLRLKATELLSDENLNFWEDNWAENVCYFGGGVLGVTMVPIDALLTGVFTVKKTLEEHEA